MGIVNTFIIKCDNKFHQLHQWGRSWGWWWWW